ncbi:MAG: glycosyltransferase family 2 protein, partial [Ignavibacteria bacterium]|nr:glycosyltransferase family 2 protein [Ignavibacteria bacterium]
MESLISVAVIAKNEENNIGKCLGSVAWADEIVLIDAYSTDNTAGVAKKYTDNIFLNEWKGFNEQRKFALSKTSHDWVLVLDADELCSEGLKEEIQAFLKNPGKFHGFRIPRKNFFLNRWIKHGGWYPGYQLRFFNKNYTKITDRLVHEGYEVSGETGFFRNNIDHYTVNSISEFMDKVNIYSSLQAEEKSSRKKVGLYDVLLRPMAAFIVQFFFRKGFMDGIYGIMVAHFDVIT